MLRYQTESGLYTMTDAVVAIANTATMIRTTVLDLTAGGDDLVKDNLIDILPRDVLRFFCALLKYEDSAILR